LRRAQGYIATEDIPRLAAEWHLPAQLIRSAAHFYDALKPTEPGPRRLQICDGEACRAAGADGLAEQVRVLLGGPDGEGRLPERVTCLGYCSCAPNLLLDGRPLSAASVGGAAGAVAAWRDPASPLPEGPRNPCHPPPDGAPCVLLRRFGQGAAAYATARSLGAYAALEKAVSAMTPEQVVAEIEQSRLRGRGGAGFPSGRKLRTVAETPSNTGHKYLVANLDEGDAGAYIDKELAEQDPHALIEGILLAAYACGADRAFIYVRHEYPRAIATLQRAIDEARGAGWYHRQAVSGEFRCDLRLIEGQGAYICGEETSLLRSIEGLPAQVSIRPPYPAESGLWGEPTAVNNVETLCNLPWIIEHGGAAYGALGNGDSRGTKLVSLNSRVARPGLYEVELGKITLREILFDLAGGMADGRQFKAVQVGGPLGAILPESLLDTPFDFESLSKVGGILGHGGMVVYGQGDDLFAIARGLLAFCARESCGKCFPCRFGSQRGVELLDRIRADGFTEERRRLLDDLLETLELGSLCGLGGMIPLPVRSVLRWFPEAFEC
jgi:NADH:ubiquinone oxidoreductase subunit F (NADH-binding)/NADH:ubiquinone oxidoreductase subunit E